MKPGEIIKEALNTCGWSQDELAKRLGYKRQSSIGSRLSRDSMRLYTFIDFLDEMGYEIVVKSKSPNKNSNEWKVTK
ncbi:MAG: DNA (cytosine-5-)-methyltransferase [Clostridia bacterium]|nr:DNA (cytosine-5-)-methyltransferase [Clostridia bacterium]